MDSARDLPNWLIVCCVASPFVGAIAGYLYVEIREWIGVTEYYGDKKEIKRILRGIKK